MRSYGVAHRELMPDAIHDTNQYTNNRAEQSHESVRVRNRGMRKFRSVIKMRQFFATHSAVSSLFNLGLHLMSACHYQDLSVDAFAEWNLAGSVNMDALLSRTRESLFVKTENIG